MSSDSIPPPDSEPPQPNTPNSLQDAIRARALHTIARGAEVHKRSPKQIITAAVLMLIAVGALLFAVDIGVRTMHRIIDIWLSIRQQASQPDVKQPYPVTVEPAAPDMSKPEPSSSSGSASTP